MHRAKFLEDCQKFWENGIAEVSGPDPADSTTWRSLKRIQAVLQPFMQIGRNHAFYPTGGGMDFRSVEIATESECLSFLIEDRLADIVKPSSLTLEYIAQAPLESFLLLDLATLAPSGANKQPGPDREGVLEYPPGKYMSGDVWERGYLRLDENGREIPLPQNSRSVTRWFRGKVLIVSKISLWNRTQATYDGQHNAMTASEIKTIIEAAVDRMTPQL